MTPSVSGARLRAFLDRLPLEREGGRQLRRLGDGSVAGDWFGCELASVFQPIVDPAGGQLAGFEAFLRVHGTGERELSPWALFSSNADDTRLVALDRLARTVHALNFITSVQDDSLLFLNVHGRLLAAVSEDHGAAFRKVLDALGLPPDRVVIEAPAAASHQPDLLAFVLRNYRLNGFRTAINLESLAQWQALSQVVPAQYVKVRTDVVSSAAPTEREVLNAIAQKARLVVTRVDDKRAALPASALVQGYAWGLPAQRAAIAGPERFALRQFAY
ncbi:MAG: EAL domain-containing protein [Thauera sp.]|nr:EAL domain-containing protein [Thauera sp.]